MSKEDYLVTSTNIEEIFGGNDCFLGIFSAHEKMPFPLAKGEFIVINLDTPEGGGTHWTCAFGVDDTGAVYYDSLGGKPPAPIEPYVKVYQDDLQQKPSSNECGLYVIRFLLIMSALTECG